MTNNSSKSKRQGFSSLSRPSASKSKSKSSSLSKGRSGGSLGQLHRDSLEFRKELQKNDSHSYRPGIDISMFVNASDWDDHVSSSKKSSRK
eukprot:CAMPEP_0116029612 /NCGR_PEP_ID=MMETSP0321-20121206/16244_1 /TAXON_ID=163516 /ORGANISM="Leptocylindrus danicus var. danicus, Strain B650" /LENGTH=90 /DNA_ID=CAMNT_0003504023 /DNA_START=134 /DNA_END=406 /DNA_ORIENTATION=+